MFVQGHEYQYDLKWIVTHILTQIKQIEALEEWKNKHASQNTQDFASVNSKIAELQKSLSDSISELSSQIESLDDFVHSPEIFSNEALTNWANENLPDLVASVVKHVFFGLNAEGYFIACVPQCWNFISFDTSLDPCDPAYGHLKLNW